jgi:hypothetical protein
VILKSWKKSKVMLRWLKKLSIVGLTIFLQVNNCLFDNTVKLGDKEQIGVEELFTDYQPFYTLNLLLDKELLPI